MDKMHTVQGWIQQRSGGLYPHTPPPPKPRIFNVTSIFAVLSVKRPYHAVLDVNIVEE
jgi:hypothetical protein